MLSTLLTQLKSQALMWLIIVCVPAAVALVFGMAVRALHNLATFLDAKTKDSKLASIAGVVAHKAEAIAADLEATLVPELKAASADGVLDKGDREHLRAVAVEKLKQLLGEQGISTVRDVMQVAGDQLNQYLVGAIEKAVDKLPVTVMPPPSTATLPSSVATTQGP
jgi:hypothetical protein